MLHKYLDKEGLEALIRLIRQGLSIDLPDLSYLETALAEIESKFTDLREKDDTYTKEEVEDLISTFPHFEFEIVDKLPDPAEARKDVIYLVVDPNSKEGNTYLEYILINNEFEALGHTTFDLSNLYTKEETYNQEEADELIIPEITVQKVRRMWFGLPDNFTLDQSKLNEGDTLA